MSVKYFCEKTGDATQRSPQHCLESVLARLGKPKERAFSNGGKVVVIMLDDNEDRYDISWEQAGMRMSEIIALLRASEVLFMQEMGLITTPGE